MPELDILQTHQVLEEETWNDIFWFIST